MKPKTFIVFSNLSFIIPFCVAFAFKYYFWSFLVLAVIVLSLLYHLAPKNNHVYYRLDHIFAWTLIAYNSIMVLGFNFYLNQYFYVTMFLVLVSIYFYFNHKKSFRYHGYWHISSSMITLFSIITALTLNK